MLAAIADNNADSFNLLQHNPHESTKSSLLAYYASLALSGLGLGGLGIHYHFPDTKAFLRLTGASVTLGGFSQIPGRISSLVWLTGGLLLLATSLGGNTPGDGFFGPPDKANDQPIDSDTQPRE